MRLILVRHGETRLNKEGRIQGLSDAPLNSTGRAQASAIAEVLAEDLHFELYTSPVPRALQTARIIGDSLRLPLTPLKALEEADAGRLDGLTGQEMRIKHPEFAEQWARDPSTARMPGGESLVQVQKRAWGAIEELAGRHPNDTVVAVSHNFTIQTVICRFLDVPLRNAQRFKQDIGSITRLELSLPTGFLLSLNETWHLRSFVRSADG